MHQLADGVWQLPGVVPHLINCYLVRTVRGDVLIDAGTRWATGRILRALRGRPLALVALTHVHPDHQGAAAEVCRRFRVPLACHEADAPVMEGLQPMVPRTPIVRLADRLFSGPTCQVALRWQDGDRLDDWEVIHLPGHTPGHVAYFRARDGVAIVGDVVRNTSLRLDVGWLSEPPAFFSVDPGQNRRSWQRLVERRPSLLCLGHGPPTRDLGALERLVGPVST